MTSHDFKEKLTPFLRHISSQFSGLPRRQIYVTVFNPPTSFKHNAKFYVFGQICV